MLGAPGSSPWLRPPKAAKLSAWPDRRALQRDRNHGRDLALHVGHEATIRRPAPPLPTDEHCDNRVVADLKLGSALVGFGEPHAPILATLARRLSTIRPLECD